MQKRVDFYSDLAKCVKVFNEGRIEIMIVEGSAGAGKSSMIKHSIKDIPTDGYCWIEGRISAVCLYDKLYLYRGLPIFIDDADGLYKDRQCINLLKCLCQTEKVKTLMWNTQNLKSESPKEFQTESKVCLITNSWRNLNKHIGAIEDRGLLITFNPSAQEVHDHVKTIPSVFDQDIYDFIGSFLGIIKVPSIRHYRNALQLKGSDLDWKEILIESFGATRNEACVLKLRPLEVSENQKAKLFAEMLTLSERSYWRTKKELEDCGIKF
jgi:hypothetical protein